MVWLISPLRIYLIFRIEGNIPGLIALSRFYFVFDLSGRDIFKQHRSCSHNVQVYQAPSLISVLACFTKYQRRERFFNIPPTRCINMVSPCAGQSFCVFLSRQKMIWSRLLIFSCDVAWCAGTISNSTCNVCLEGTFSSSLGTISYKQLSLCAGFGLQLNHNAWLCVDVCSRWQEWQTKSIAKVARTELIPVTMVRKPSTRTSSVDLLLKLLDGN